MSHRDAVVDRDRVELARDSAGRGDRIGNDAADGLQMGVAGNELGKLFATAMIGLPKSSPFTPRCSQQRTGPSHVASVRDGSRSKCRHVDDNAGRGRQQEDSFGTGIATTTFPRRTLVELPCDHRPGLCRSA